MRETLAATNFGQWLSRQRKARDLTQEDLAERLGCSVWSIQKIEVGTRRPSRQVAELLAGYFDIPDGERAAFLQFARGLAGEWDHPPAAAGPQTGPGTLSHPNNLPVQLTSFVGRDIELPRIRDLMLTADVRLLTLTGPPGTGKTRLALQAAAELLPYFDDGVFFVNLAPISDASLVISEIAQNLGVSSSGARSLFEAVEGYLRDRRLLLVLDNFEQVAVAAPPVAELLMRAPRVKVLATSRVPLHVRGEKEFAVPPLQLPDTEHLPPLDQLGRYEAVRLFVQRAADVNAGFEMTGDNASTVAQICARLDGLPLAIELAAARVKVLSPQGILERLESRLGLLTGGARDLPARQRTLRSAIEWSYDLLAEEEKKLFRRLGVFVGGFTLDAAEAVCRGGTGRQQSAQDPPLRREAGTLSPIEIDLLDGIASLVDSSLLRQQEGAAQEPRFVMLETIHEYARDRLQESGGKEAVSLLHALYFMALAEEANLKVWGLTEAGWLDRLDEEHDNLRAAIAWGHEVKGDAEIELRLAVALARFWEIRGYLYEGRERIAAALSRPESREEKVTALRAWALTQSASLNFWQSDYQAARLATEEALAIFQALGEQAGIARALTDLSDVARAQGDYGKALVLGEQSLDVNRALGDAHGTVVSLVMVGWAEMRPGYYARAAQHLEEALELARQIKVPNRIGLALSALGEVMLRLGNYERAISLLEESLAIRRSTGYRWGIAATLGTIALAAIQQHDFARATEMLAESLTLRKERGDKGGVAWCLERFAGVESEGGDAVRAVRLLGAASALRMALGTVVDMGDEAAYEQALTTTRSRLNDADFVEAWQEGRAMIMNAAIAYALDGA
jgi:predicted ATPase/transcriptional regulator with XRE-family HTH domain